MDWIEEHAEKFSESFAASLREKGELSEEKIQEYKARLKDNNIKTITNSGFQTLEEWRNSLKAENKKEYQSVFQSYTVEEKYKKVNG